VTNPRDLANVAKIPLTLIDKKTNVTKGVIELYFFIVHSTPPQSIKNTGSKYTPLPNKYSALCNTSCPATPALPKKANIKRPAKTASIIAKIMRFARSGTSKPI